MQMIDVYAPAGVFDDKHQLARDLAAEVMLIERGSDVVLLRENTAAFIHEFPNDSMANVDGASDCVRVQVLTNVDALDPSERIAMVAPLRAVIAGAPGNPPPAWRIGVLFTQASEGDGGWGPRSRQRRADRLARRQIAAAAQGLRARIGVSRSRSDTAGRSPAMTQA